MASNERLDGRNGAVWRRFCDGASQYRIADEFGISQQRVSQIINVARSEIDTVTREEHFAAELEFLHDLKADMMQQVRAPLPPAFHSRTGTVMVDPRDGTIILDDSSRIAAVDRAIKLHERVSKLLGLDAPTKADLTVTDAAEEASRKRAAEAAARLHGLTDDNA